MECETTYRAHDLNYNWELAKSTCQGKGKELAKVSDPNELTKAKDVFIATKFPRNYWIGLKYDSGFKWSDGTAAKRGADGVDSILSSIETNLTTPRCFYVTDKDTLQSKSCSQGEKFICERTGIEF